MGVAALPLLGQSLLPSFKERDFLMHWVTVPGTGQPEMFRITARPTTSSSRSPASGTPGRTSGRPC